MGQKLIKASASVLALLGASVVGVDSASGLPEQCSGYVALTYDDGPSDWTWGVSEELRAAGLHATFFLGGLSSGNNPGTVAKVFSDGMAIGNHAYDHPSLPGMSPDSVDWQLRGTSEAIAEAGVPTPTLFRPPYGAIDDTVYGLAAWNNMHVIGWTLDTNDWQGKTAQQVADIVATAQDQDIILMHDESEQDMLAVPLIADALEAKGLCTGRIEPGGPTRSTWEGFDFNASVEPW